MRFESVSAGPPGPPSRRLARMKNVHALRTPREGLPLFVAAGLAAAGGALLTVSAYILSPLALPAALVAVAFVVVAVARPAIGVAGALLASPLELMNVALPTGAVSPSEAALIVVGGAWVVRALLRSEGVPSPALRDAPIFVLLGVIAIGAASASEPETSLRILVFWALFYGVYLEAQAFTPRDMRIVIWAFVIGAGILGAIGALDYLRSGGTELYDGGAVTGERITGTFADPNYFASLLTMALLPGIALLLADYRREAWLLVGLLGALGGLIFSLSRGGIAGFAIAILLLLVWRRARWVAVAIAVLFVVLTLANANPLFESERLGVVEQRLATLSDPGRDSKRPEIWSTAVTIAVDNPFFGVGANMFESEAAQRGLTEAGVPLENAHSIPLSFAAETGVIGLAAFLAFVVQLVLRAARALASRDRLRRPLALGISAGLLAFMIQGLTATQLRTNLIAGTFFVLAGMLTGLADREAGERHAAEAGASEGAGAVGPAPARAS